MKYVQLIVLSLAMALAAVGCDKKEEAGGDEAKAEQPAEGEAAEETEGSDEKPAEEGEAAAEGDEKAETVEVAAATKFDPPVKPEQLPDGVWYCDMGTVHWAGTEKPEDGKCPECGMKLKQYSASGHADMKEGAMEAKEGDGHHHDGEGEDGHHHEGGEEHHEH